MGDDPKAGNPRHPAPDAGYTSPGSGPDRREKRPGIALPADLGRSLRLLDNAATVTSGQQRLILAAYKAGLKPAAIAKEFRVSRATVQNVITSANAEGRSDK